VQASVIRSAKQGQVRTHVLLDLTVRARGCTQGVERVVLAKSRAAVDGVRVLGRDDACRASIQHHKARGDEGGLTGVDDRVDPLADEWRRACEAEPRVRRGREGGGSEEGREGAGEHCVEESTRELPMRGTSIDPLALYQHEAVVPMRASVGREVWWGCQQCKCSCWSHRT
jgi:hypothetical protein